MDWLTKQVLISIVSGLFTLAFFLRKRKKNESGEVCLEQRAQEIIKQHLSVNTPSYADVKSDGFTGYMEVYLQHSRNVQTMSSAADYNVMLELASVDQFRNQNTIFNSLLKL